jgi:hypothetical protein
MFLVLIDSELPGGRFTREIALLIKWEMNHERQKMTLFFDDCSK